MFKFEIINPPKSFIIKEKIIKEIFKEISILEGNNFLGILNIVFVNNEEIKKLNNDYREKDSVTDVLSFHYYDDFSKLEAEEVAGEIILSEEKIISQGKEYKLGSELEFYKLLIHSIFHIIGYDHENEQDYKIMNKNEEYIWKKIFN